MKGNNMQDELVIAGKRFSSRLMIGTGKYDSPQACLAALDASGAEIVTVAIRRLDLDNPKKQTELDYIDWSRYTVLPNTAGSTTVDEALFTARLGRELTGSDWVKLEVIPDPVQIIIENANVPVVVDAGIGSPSDAALAMETGADAVLINTSIALSQDPPLMAAAMRQGVEAGRKAFLAGRIPKKAYASASSPLEGVPGARPRQPVS
jgi:thiazole synthase